VSSYEAVTCGSKNRNSTSGQNIYDKLKKDISSGIIMSLDLVTANLAQSVAISEKQENTARKAQVIGA